MKLKLEVDSEDPKAPEMCWFLGNCLEEWQKPALEIAAVTKERECHRCHTSHMTPQLRGIFVCDTCKATSET